MTNLSASLRSALVVDDSAVQRAFAVDLCRQLGITEIIEASDGESAMQKLTASTSLPDVVILDLEMPGVDGVELAERMHAADMLIPLVIVSARDTDVIASVEKLVSAIGLPVLDALKKPIKLDALRAALEKYCD